MYHFDREANYEHIDGLIQRYRNGEISTPVFTASLRGCHLQADEIADTVARHIFVHQASLPYRRGDFQS